MNDRVAPFVAFRTRLFAILLLFVIATSGYGDEAAREAVNNERGFVPEKLYQFGGIDSVNLFNGNLTLSIPIGGSAPVSSNLSYGLTLYYNSKLWNAESLMTGNQCGDGAQQDAGNVAFPVASRMNAGLGWSFGFGWVTPEGAYNTPDGAYHPFGVGHPYNPPVNDIVKVWYSSDGSNLRMMKTTAGKFRVEFPDGSFHTFGADGSIESMNDRFGNSVVITSVKLATIWTWTATDAHRTQTIRLKKAAPSSEDPGTQARRFPVFEWVVDEVELTAFSAPGTSTTAIYKFEYDDADIRRGCANAYRDPCTTNVRIPLLAALILPDGSRYAFAYNRPSDTCFATGTLMKMTLPTGGGLGWDYVDYTLPSNGCATVASGLQWKNYTLGVKTKTLYGPGDTAQGKWEYWQHLAEADPIPNICPPQSLPNGNFEYDATHYGAEHSITAVTDPEGRTAWHYFATWNSDINPGYENANQAHEYGLPFTRAISIDADGDPARPRFLSREICESGTGHDEAHPCVPLRKMYLRYNETSPLDLYPRRSVIAEHTQFIEDPGAPEPLGGLPYIDSESSDYDGHGNHRTAVVRSSFGPTRTTFTDYNPGSDEHGKEGDAPYLGPGEPWVLHRYTTEKVTETEVTGTGTRTFESTAKACFDPFGQLLGKRWLAGATEDEKDVVVRYGYVTGERVSEDWYGGDRPQFAVDTNFNLCSDSDESEYQLTHTYTAGILATTKYRGLNYPSVDQTIDPGTGLVRSSRDTAGVETTYDYDVLRRLKSVTPAGREATKYCYTTPLATGPSCYNAASLLKPEPGSDVSVLITRGPAGDQGTQSMVVFDRWGRVRREYTLMPDGLASYRETTLDKLGRRTSVTELGRGDDLPKTLFEYDRFDRVTLITPPDHTTARESTTAFSYAGVWETNRTSFLTLPNGNQTVTTKEKYDAFGRLIEVTQNAGPTTVQASAGAAVLAKYGYDQGGRLRSVSMGLAGDTTPQEREFDYDGRGLLTREKHPESGETLYEYDSRSHLWKKNAAGTGFDLEYDYDSAERLLRTRALPSGDVIKQFEFGPDGHKRGRLIKATRMNYAPDGSGETIRVVEEYDYDLAGRLDERKTSIATAADLDAAGELLFQPITQSVAYDTLDRETAVTYPWCTSCGQPDADPENTGRLVTSTYQYGRVYSVDGFVGSTSYGENALWAERTHTNGVREVQVPETTTGMARPAQLLVYNIANCPVISLQPQNVQVNAAGTATLTVGSSVPGATFTWYEGVRGDTSKPVPNGSSSTLQVGPLTETKWYWCRVFSPDSACAEDSETAQVSVCVPPVITSPAADFAGEPVVVLKSASGTDPIEIRVIAGGTTLSYHWRVEHYENGLWISDDIVANAPSIPFSRSSVGTFRFFVSLTSGCGTAARLVTVIQVVDASEPAPVCTIPEIATGFPAQIRVTAGRPSVDLEVTLQPEAGAETWPADPNGFFFRWSVDGNPVHYGPKRWKFSADIPSAKTIKVEVSRICGELRSPQVTRQAFVWNVDNCPEPPMSVDQTSIALDDPDAKKEFTASSVWHTVTFEWYRGDSGNTRDLIHEGPAFASDEAGTYWVRAIGRCEMHTDGPTLTVTDGSCKPLELLRQPASANIHAGTPHVLSFETSQPAPDKIYWYEGLGTLNRLDAHLNSYGAAPIRTTTYWARAVRTGCHTADSMYATLHVTSCDDITVTEIPAGTTMTWDEFGSAHPLRVTANSPFPLAYQWYQGESGDTSVPVANADVPQIAVKPEETTKYWARISIAGGCAIDTAAVTVQVCHKPEIILQPTSRISVPGYGIWLAVDAKGTALSYQWYLGGEDDESHPILNANLSQYMATPSQTTQYWVRISDACAADGTHVDSEVVTISIAPSIVTQPLGGPAAKSSTRTLTVEAAGAALTYQWYLGPDDSQPIAGAIGASYTTPPLLADVTYWVRVYSGDAWVDSESAALTVCQPRGIVMNQPSTVSGSTVTLRVDFPDSNESYEWYTGESGDTTTLVNTATQISVTPAVTSKYWLRTNAGGCPADSPAWIVAVCFPNITVQPASVMVNPNATATLSVTASGDPALTYQWYEGTSGVTTTPIAGATAETFTTPALTATKSYWVAVSNQPSAYCNSTTVHSAAAAITICTPPNITSDPGSRTSTANAPVALTVAADGTERTYQWYAGTKGTTTNPISGATGTTLNVTPSMTSNYWVRVSGLCGSDDSETAKVSIPPVITAEPASASVTQGTTRTLSVSASGTELTYQWHDGASNPIPGATSSTYPTPAIHSNTSYWVRVSSGIAYTDSQIATLTVCLPRAVILSNPHKVAGALVTLQVDSPDTGETFEWYAGPSGTTTTPLGTGTSRNVAPNETTQYWVRTKRAGCDADSAAVTAQICIPRINTQPANASINPGQTTTLTVTATGPGPLTYQWYQGDAGVTTTPVGTNSASYTTAALSSTTKYWVRVSSPAASGCSTTANNSTAATVTVCVPPNITSDPLTQTSTANAAVTLSVAATGTAPAYQWYIGASGVTANPIANATGTSFNVYPAETTNYWVRVTGSCGTDDSTTAKISIPPVITAQPASAAVTKGSSRTLSVTASGTELTYQWYDAASNPISGATAASYPTGAIHSDTSYWVRVTSGHAHTDSAPAMLTVCMPRGVVLSNPHKVAGALVTLSVDGSDAGETFEWYAGPSGTTTTLLGTGTSRNVAPNETTQYWVRTKRAGCDADSAAVTAQICIPRINTQPANASIDSGQTASFSVTATGPGPLTYQWYQGDAGVTTTPVGTNSASYTTTPLSATTKYWVRVSSPVTAGCATTVNNSNAATVTVCNAVSITAQPQPNHISQTQSVTLTVTATGNVTSYQWYQGAAGVTTTPVGTNSNTLQIVPGSTKSYWVRVNGSCGSADSVAALQSVVPVFTTSPASSSVCGGQPVTLTAVATGDPATITYQWYRRAVGASTWTAVGSNSTTYTFTVTEATEVVCNAVSGTAAHQTNPATISVITAPDIYNTSIQPLGSDTYRLTASILIGTENWGLQWYQGALGNTSSPYSQSNPTDVYAPTRPAPFWIRVTDNDNGCYADKLLTVQ